MRAIEITTSASPMRARRPARTGDARASYAFLAPTLLLLGVVFIIPFFLTFLASFLGRDVDPVPNEVFAPQNLASFGLHNYIRAFRDPVWLESMLTTLIFGLGMTIIGMSMSMALALLMNHVNHARSILLALTLIPWAIPPVVNGTIWGLVVHGDIGTLNGVLSSLGLIDTYEVWLGTPGGALVVVIVASAWRFVPLMTLLILAGLQQLDQEPYEAAKMDGAGGLQQFWYLTLPGIRPVLFSVGLLSIIWSTKVFDEIFVLTGGGPGYSTTVMNLWVYRQAFEFLRFGYASALAYILAVVAGILAISYMALSRRATR